MPSLTVTCLFKHYMLQKTFSSGHEYSSHPLVLHSPLPSCTQGRICSAALPFPFKNTGVGGGTEPPRCQLHTSKYPLKQERYPTIAAKCSSTQHSRLQQAEEAKENKMIPRRTNYWPFRQGTGLLSNPVSEDTTLPSSHCITGTQNLQVNLRASVCNYKGWW